VVEGLVKYSRLNFMVPTPRVADFAQLNADLARCCAGDLKRRLRGKPTTKAELLVEDRAAMLPLPPAPFEAARTISTRANSLSLARFDRNDYSVPVRWAHHPLVVKGYCWEVALCAQGREVARHRRIWDKEQVCFEPRHYLALLERKPGALDYALPLDGWELPACLGGSGVREYIRVLRLLEKHSMSALSEAVDKAMEHGAQSRDAIAQFLYPPERHEDQTFKLEGHPHLKGVKVNSPNIGDYAQLLGGSR